MIRWQNPAAFWALAILAVPIVIHLLRRHRAERVLFPSLRFVRASQTAAVRLLPPADLLLLAVRLLTLAAAVAALAGPIVVTDARTEAWNATVARVVIVDSSDSMRVDAVRQAADEAAGAEQRTAAYSRRIDVEHLADGVRRAAQWLESTPPSRGEIVIVSDFQRGAIDAVTMSDERARLPESVGLRMVPIGAAAQAVTFDGLALLAADGVGSRSQSIDLTADATAVAIRDTTAVGSGLEIIASDGDADVVARLRRTLGRAGSLAPSAEQPIVVRLAGAAPLSTASLEPVQQGWMLRTFLRLSKDASLVFDESAARAPSASERPWSVAIRDATGRAMVSAAASKGSLIVDVAAAPDSFEAAEVVRALLAARADADAYAEREIARVPAADLAAFARPSGAVDDSAWRRADRTDARWLWLAALVFLVIEQWLRGVRQVREEVVRAAA